MVYLVILSASSIEYHFTASAVCAFPYLSEDKGNHKEYETLYKKYIDIESMDPFY